MKNCGTCGFRLLDAHTGKRYCAITKLFVEADDGCTKHNPNPDKCDMCGQPIVSPTGTLVVEIDNGYHVLCQSCAPHYHTCNTCIVGDKCTFQDMSLYPSISPIIMKTQQQGMMVVQTQVKNPEREKVTCHNCGCWNEENGCMREVLGCCSSYIYIHQHGWNGAS